MNRRAAYASCAVILSASGWTWGDTVTIIPNKDNTLIESPTGALSNGAGSRFFAGTTSQATDEVRRAVMAFDVAGSIPTGSTITSASLTLFVVQTNMPGPVDCELHRLLANWGEGTSVGGGGEAMGAPSAANDATWIHRFFNTSLWAAAGGDFSPTVSASTAVGAENLFFTWGSTPQMVTDVQGWLSTPANNFGWILLGDEELQPSSKGFASRTHSIPANRPMLTIEFTPPPPIPTMSEWGALGLALLLTSCGAVVVWRRCAA